MDPSSNDLLMSTLSVFHGGEYIDVEIPEGLSTVDGSVPFKPEDLGTIGCSMRNPRRLPGVSVLDIYGLVIGGTSTASSDLNRLGHGLLNSCTNDHTDLSYLISITKPFADVEEPRFQILGSTKAICGLFQSTDDLLAYNMEDIQSDLWVRRKLINPVQQKPVETTTDPESLVGSAGPAAQPGSKLGTVQPIPVFAFSEFAKAIGYDGVENLTEMLNLSNVYATAHAFASTCLRLALKEEKAVEYLKTAKFVNNLSLAGGPVSRELYNWLMTLAIKNGMFGILLQNELTKVNLISVLRWAQMNCPFASANVAAGVGCVGVMGYGHSVLMTIESCAKEAGARCADILVSIGIRDCDKYVVTCRVEAANLRMTNRWYLYIHAIRPTYTKFFSMPKMKHLAFCAVAIQKLFSEESVNLDTISLGFNITSKARATLIKVANRVYEKYGGADVGTATIRKGGLRGGKPPLPEGEDEKSGDKEATRPEVRAPVIPQKNIQKALLKI